MKFVFEPCPTCHRDRRVVDGAWLRQQRKRSGLSLRELARRIGVSPPYLSDVELNRRGRTAKIVEVYAVLARQQEQALKGGLESAKESKEE